MTLREKPHSRATRIGLPVALTSLLAAAGPAAGQEREDGYVQLANEYFLTASVYPQERGEVQLTTTPWMGFEEGRQAFLPLAIEVGLTDRWQVELEWVAFATLRPEGLPEESGIGDLEVETQYSFMNVGGGSTHAAVSVGLTLPTGSPDTGISEGFVELEPSVSIARDVLTAGRRSQIFGQLALGIVRRAKEPSDPSDREPAAHELVAGAGYALAVGSSRLMAELSWTTSRWNNDGEEAGLYLSPGVVWDLPGTWELGIGAPLGLAGDTESARVSLIFLYEFELGDGD